MHPLSGADLGTLWRVFAQSGGIPPSKWAEASAIWLAALGRLPMTAMEYWALSNRLPALDDMTPPVFIIGHWRSGTTHLYNVMSQANFGYVPPLATGLPWDLMGIGRVMRPFLERALPETRYIDNVPVLPTSPQEDEIALANMTPLSFYHAIYFPQRFQSYLTEGLFFDHLTEAQIKAWQDTFLYFMRKLSLHQGHKRLLIKNPVYTARVDRLHTMMPDARYIHILRNPYEVFISMRNFYSKLLKQFALQPYDHVDIDSAILTVYARMMEKMEEDLARLPRHLYTELRYEELDRNPLGSLEHIYDALDLGSFEAMRPIFQTYLDSVRSYEKNRFEYSVQMADLVESHLGRFIEKWGYARPGQS
ncbi:MAG: sulfotransferase [Alphaproteobacteria bacterium]